MFKNRVTLIGKKMRENHLRCLSYVQQNLINTPMRKNDLILVDRVKRQQKV